MSDPGGTLWVVATPIGNLEDLSARARLVLAHVAAIAAEDTRHTRQLLMHCGIGTPLLALHGHNEAAQTPVLVARLQRGEDLALVSDAGTPLLSDPGYLLVRAARAAGLRVTPVPGPSALVAALSVAGLPCTRFVFEGFLPAAAGARRNRLRELAAETRTLVFYEAPHRLLSTLEDLQRVLGMERELTVARELTKPYEEFWKGTVQSALVESEKGRFRGELVLVLAPGGPRQPVRLSPTSDAFWSALVALVSEYVDQGLSDTDAIRRVASQFRVPRRAVYNRVHS